MSMHFTRSSLLQLHPLFVLHFILICISNQEGPHWSVGAVGVSPSSNSGPVSFFGASHVSVKIVEARSTSDIYFRLRTMRLDSMLFLAAGRTDYCLLVLDSGRLKVHINLGAGETEIGSDAPFMLNDMAWHTVNLTRRGAALTLQVDQHVTRGTLPSRFHELNIHFGVWLGGLATFNEIFLGNLPSFRGCMSEVSFNGEDLLAKSKSHPALASSSGVVWNCSDEFDAGAGDPFSLTTPSSYLMSRLAIPRSGTSFSLALSPTQEEGESDGVILYASGLTSRPDYVGVEMRKGIIRVVVEMGGGPLVAISTTNITRVAEMSGMLTWHRVSVQVSPYSLTLRVGNETVTAEGSGRGVSSRHLDVSELLYLGVEESRKVKLKGQGFLETSFRGCIKELIIDSKGIGLPQADVTSNISSGCGGKSKPVPDEITPPPSVVTISRNLFRLVTRTEMGELEILRVTPLQVAEGDSTLITPRHLSVTLDLAKFGIRESGVLFRIRSDPEEGRVEVTKGGGFGGTDAFSLLDMGAGRVRYWHNGMESSKDRLELMLQLIPSPPFLLPAYLQDERLVTLPIEVTAVNDPPEIRLVPGGVLRLAEGTKIRLSADVVSSLDPDTPPEELTFSILSTGSERGGQLELDSAPGKPIRNFTQGDLLSNRVWYVDGGGSSSKLALRVTDGSSISATAVLRVETFPLRIAPEVNTGLEVASVAGTSVLISSGNLSFTSNAGEQGLVLEYHVVSPPNAGGLQLRRSNGQWTATDTFSQTHLSGGRLRYVLQRATERGSEDEFSFHIALAETKMPTEFRFRFRILPLRLKQKGESSLVLNETSASPIRLQFQTFPLSLSDTAISFTVATPPSLGFISSSPGSKPVTSWTQGDGLEGKIIFAFKWTPYSSLSDYFTYNVTATHLDQSIMDGPFRCDVIHMTRRKPVGMSIKPLIVQEGGRESISSKIVRIRISGESELLSFNVTNPPAHGRLERLPLLPSSASPIILTTGSTFTSTDLDRGRLFYTHDGSESPRDKLVLVVWSASPSSLLSITLDIIVKGVNNHPPTRAATASLILHLVSGSSRTITPSILDYVDGDWDGERAGLQYTSKGAVPPGIGQLYSASTNVPVFSWTQADIDGGRLRWRQDPGGKATQGALTYWVTDGKFVVNGSLLIRSGPPWVRLGNSSTLIARSGGITPLTKHIIQVDTNVEVVMEDVMVRVIEGPKNGELQVGGMAQSEFSLGEMASGDVRYASTEGSGGRTELGRDGFRFSVEVGGAGGSSHVDIAIYPEAYWEPLVIGANRSVSVGENSSAMISQNSIHIANPHIPPADIVFTLVKLPSHGYLTIDPSPSHEESEDVSVTMWDQTTLNEGRLRYVHSTPNTSSDSMTFTITNGVLSLSPLILTFTVIPSTLLLTSSTPIILQEGSSTLINSTHIHPSAYYFEGKVVDLRILEGPKHGHLGLLPRPDDPLPSTPILYTHVSQGTSLLYTHDGSETDMDEFTVVGVAVVGGVRYASPPCRISISILSTNDQVPIIVNNSGGWVWLGGSTPLTNIQLAATDADSEEGQLTFYVVGSRGGYPALVSRPNDPLTNFTQAQLNASTLVFVHKGLDLLQSSFDFEVSDGLNEAEQDTFRVDVRKPEVKAIEGRVSLPVFPFTRAPITSENVLVRSSDGREVHFQITTLPQFGSLVLDMGQGSYAPVSVFSQSNVSSGSVFYEHTKSGGDGDRIRLTASSMYAESLQNILVDIDISVSGAALGGLSRYVVVTEVEVKEGGEAFINERNLNLSAVEEFIAAQHRGNVWAGGLPTLRLQVSEVPKHGYIIESEEHRLRPGAQLFPSLLSTRAYLSYLHDDSETLSDFINFSLWLLTSNSSTASISASSTFLVNITLPIKITPINDQPPTMVQQKSTPIPVVQGHWRKLTRNDIFVSDSDTPSSQITFYTRKLSHGRLMLIPGNIVTTSPVASFTDLELLNGLPNAERFTQADIDDGRALILHNGPLSPIQLSLEVSDGEHGPLQTFLSIPVQPLTLTSLNPSPLQVLQGSSTSVPFSTVQFPLHTNGVVGQLVYNVTRAPLHGKLFYSSEQQRVVTTFSHTDLLHSQIIYHQQDITVSNDSFEISALLPTSINNLDSFPKSTPSAIWLVPVVVAPLIKRVVEVRSFVHGFAVGGIISPESFFASPDHPTTLTLALLDASPLAGLTGANPIYELLLPPKYGRLVKLQARSERGLNSNGGRPAGRWSHEDVRRGLLLYVPQGGYSSNELFPRQSQQVPEWDEFIFKLIAPGVQPAIGLAKFSLRPPFFVDPDKGHTEIISDGSTDSATKRGGGGGRMRDITYLVTPHLTRDSLLLIGLIIGGVMSASLVLIVGIRCSCSKKNKRHQNNGMRKNSNQNGGGGKNGGGGGIIDAFAHPHGVDCDETAGLSIERVSSEPLMMSTLSPRGTSSRNKVSMTRGGSDSGSWTSSNLRNDTPTPSLPQCRVTPLCSSHDNHHHQPPPICDTFGMHALNEELHPEQYGFSYGNIPPPLDLPHHEDDTAFALLSSNCSTMTRATNTPNLLSGAGGGGTLRKNHPPKNQYWV